MSNPNRPITKRPVCLSEDLSGPTVTLDWIELIEYGQIDTVNLRSLFLLIFGLSKQTFQFLQQYIVKNVHPVYGTGILTHDHLT